MSDIKLFLSCHKSNVHIPKSDLLYPIQVGAAMADVRLAGMLHDDEGENISVKNKTYCEITGQYWAWKNTKADYYGFLHYRRYFNFSDVEFPVHHEPFIYGDVVMPSNRSASLKKIAFNDKRIQEVVESAGLILPTLTESPEGETIYDQYKGSAGHHIEDLDTALDIVHRVTPEMSASIDAYMNSTSGLFCNMFIMPADMFDAYSQWLFTILEDLEQKRDFSNYPPVDARVMGYVAERLCGLYLYHQKKNGVPCKELQRVYFSNTDERRGKKQIIKDLLGK